MVAILESVVAINVRFETSYQIIHLFKRARKHELILGIRDSFLGKLIALSIELLEFCQFLTRVVKIAGEVVLY